MFVTNRSVSISVGAGAEISAAGIYLIAQAEDRSLAEFLGASKEVDNFVITPLTGFLDGLLLQLPVKVLVKSSTATITIGEGAQVLGTDTVGIYATSSADASGGAQGSLFSIGYAQATATSTVDIATGVRIESTAAIVITADARRRRRR